MSGAGVVTCMADESGTGRTSLHRYLLTRLAVLILAATTLVAVIVWLTLRDSYANLALEQVQQAATFITFHMGDRLDGSPAGQSALQRELKRFASLRRERFAGSIIAARIFDPAGKLLAGFEDPDQTSNRATLDWLDSDPVRIPLPPAARLEVRRFDDHPYVRVSVPVIAEGDRVLSWCTAILRISDAAIADVRYRILRAIALAVGLIISTAALFYPVVIRLVNRLSRLSVNLLDANLEVIKVLGSAIAKKDSDTDAHNYRVTLMAVQLAEALGLEPDRIRALIKGAFLHDVGKIGVPDAVLLKPGRLDEHEFSIMKQHVDHGLDIIGRSAWLADAAEIVGGHHEKFNGDGYPAGLANDGVSILARIFALVDVFDALTCRRPYKEPMPYEKAMQILEAGRGNHFDPVVLDAFTGLSRKFYNSIAQREDAALREEAGTLMRRYFEVSIEVFI
jgi:HD-GYP domain-containing protein (c-di-GMP phosphodiesterase class II)